MTDIGAKISIDGEKQFRQELKEITQQGKTLSAEMENVKTAFNNADDAEKDYSAITKKLNEQIENQKKLVDKLQEAVQRSAEKTGENSVETQKWKEKLAKAEKGLNDLEKEARDATGGVKNLGDEEEKTTDKTSVFGDVLKGSLASEAIQKGLSMTISVIKDLAGAFVDAIKDTAAYADEVNTLSKTTGMSTDAIQEWKYMAELLDVSFETVEGSLTKLTKSMDEARSGSEKQSKAFADLGIEITDANGQLRDSNEVFEDVIKALRKIENPTERDAAAMDLLGKSAKDLNPLIMTSESTLKALRKEAHDVGAVMDKDTLESMNAVQDSMDRFGGTWEALKRTIAAKVSVAILPELEKIVGLFQELVKTGNISQFIDKITRELGNEKKWKGVGEKVGELLGKILGSAPKIIAAGGELVLGLLKGVIGSIPNIGKTIAEELYNTSLSDACRDLKYELDNVKKKLEEIPGGAERVGEALGNMNASQQEAEHWIEIFDELSQVTEPTAEQSERLNIAVEKLNELYPELGLAIDTETGKWNMNTQEIRGNIKALHARYEAEAYYAAASDIMKDVAKLEVESRAYREKADALLEVKDAAEKTYQETEKQRKQLNEMRVAANAGTMAWEDYERVLKSMGLTESTAYQREMELAEAANNQKSALDEATRQYDFATAAVKEYDNKIGELQGDIDFLYDKASEKEEEYFTTEWANKTKRWMKKLRESANTMRTKAEVIGEEIGNGLIAGMDKVSSKVTDRAGSLINGVIRRMKNEAQIQSPSKVTRDLIGKNLALGVMEGWESVMDGFEFKNAMSLTGTINGMQNEIRPITNNETTNLGGVTINVTGPQGMNENKLAEIIMRKMQSAVDRRRNVFSNELHVR